MNVFAPRNTFFRIRRLLAVVAIAMLAIGMPQLARAADADSGQTIECMLPGQIHNVAGHATMGARRPIETTPADCRERGGEYTVDEHADQSMTVAQAPVANANDRRLIRCLLPKQVRQLGEKARYTTARHTIHTTRSDCQARGGDVIGPAHSHRTVPKK